MSGRSRRRPSAVDFGQALDRKSEALRRESGPTPDQSTPEAAPAVIPDPAPEVPPAPAPAAPAGPSPTVRFGYRMTLPESDTTDRLVHQLRARTGNRRLTKGDMLRALALIASQDESLMERVADSVDSLEKLAR